MFNGKESARLSLSSALSVPSCSATASLKASVSLRADLGGSFNISSPNITPPAFSFGSSAALGTSIPGAFSADFQTGGGLSAGSIMSGGIQLHSTNTSAQASSSFSISASSKSSSDIGYSIEPRLRNNINNNKERRKGYARDYQ